MATSDFTHDDSALTPVHTSNPAHMAAVLEGEVVPDQQLKAVVLGPGAFGSPDPATLAHTLLTDGDEQMKSDTAPEVELPSDSSSASSSGLNAEDSKAGEFTDAVRNANTVEELDAIEEEHDKRDEPFKSVQDALDRRRAQLEEADDNDDNS